MKILLVLAVLFFSLPAPAQILKKLKDKAVNKGKSEVNDAKYDAKMKARNTVKDEMEGIKADFDSTDIDYAILLSDNSGLFGGQGKGEFGAKFLKLGSIARSLYRDVDIDDDETATLNLQMGQSAYAMGKYVFAEKRLRSAQYFFEKAYQTSDIPYMKTIASEGLLFTTMGRFPQAEQFTTQALDLRRSRLGENNMAVAASLNNYAVLHYNLGKYNESEKEFNQALGVIKANKLQEGISYAIVLNNQAILFQSMGRYEAAVKLMQDAIQISTRQTSKGRHNLKFLSNLALLFQQMEKYTEAEKIYQGLEGKLEKGKPEFANLLNNGAILAMLMKKEDRVEDMLKRSADIYKTALGENGPAYAKVISDLGNYYRYKARYAEAEPLLQKVLQIREQTLGIVHPLYVQSQENMAILLWKKKDLAKAYPLYHDAMEKTIDFINGYFPPMSEAEKTKYWDLLSPRFQRFYNFAIEAAGVNKDIMSDLFEYRTATKGLLFSSTRKISQTILASGNEQLVKDYNEWIDHKEELTNYYAYSKEELKEQGMDLDSMEAVVNRMGKKLSENSKEFGSFFFSGKTKVSEIQRELKSDEALIEIIRVRNFDQVFNDNCRYIGLVITKNSSQPKMVMLENGNDLEVKHARTYKLSIKNKINDDQSYKQYWEPFEAETKGKKTLYVSLDGVYSQLNLNTLKKAGGDYLLNLFDIVLIGNPKDIANAKAKMSSGASKNAMLIGYPDYGKGSITQLPGTKLEIENINKDLKSSGYQVEMLMQKDATETNFKAVKGVSVLHIATHGYFLKDVEHASWPIGVHADNARNNVLLRSGLMLTGASEADKNKSGLDDSNNGILTSYEIMNLDLKETFIVGVSACETGLGEVKAGEGVYGLQRAFGVAGAANVVMSLWKVDDAATKELMDNFYANWLKTNDKQKAFKQAQQQLMTKFKEPFYWGAFVMMEGQ
ncbi:MAG TPA: CHAT domain-containing tetratricopeptide repeat protein [Chitinophagaceae bacterium]|jgi:CHAT domain-containing protein/Flp pilus assembly protein TadD|nr:CHAT domain-containing tetratricopeptide repeat protein [Chitinophagaceae bacterium]